ncbi:hypothetical protein [Thermococcus sp.]|nr:hypothetical protein [Thermococcus sp.]
MVGVRFISTGDIPEILAIFLFALYGALLPKTHRDLLFLVGASMLALS